MFIKGFHSYFQETIKLRHRLIAREVLKMCKGAEEKKHGGSCRSFQPTLPAATTGFRCCELCGLDASLYCQADDAYLCPKCDKRVHEANFLALRHIRCFLCNTCQNLTRRYLIGASFEVLLPNNSNNRKCSRMHNITYHFL
ncbi:putative transcription factor interactor and regulator Znf-B family [Lupinus albus]|uniref:Putative transcription factor interactor and regulator Znf-B family n=1 Tax=Lupinus albus TaxID=3870 RepID=A0A6A4NMI8_LUPAL|nr:putative transcription factor interactor and regulator Znf-B family [Lupinus albus]